jgi:putative phosphoribosyl transferase
MRFANRRAAGVLLAEQLKRDLASQVDTPPVILALPRGGVPVAYELARAFTAPLDVWLVRKIGVPGQEELAAGAIADGGVAIWNNDVLAYEGLTPADLAQTVKRERAELERRRHAYCGDHRPPRSSRRVQTPMRNR